MPDSTPWAHLPNAALIDHLLRALPTLPPMARTAAWHSERAAAMSAAWTAMTAARRHNARTRPVLVAATDAIRDAGAYGYHWQTELDDLKQTALLVATALIAWDNMGTYINALPGRPGAPMLRDGASGVHKALAAQLYQMLTQHATERTL